MRARARSLAFNSAGQCSRYQAVDEPVDGSDAPGLSGGGICGWGPETSVAVSGPVYISDQAGHLTAYALPSH